MTSSSPLVTLANSQYPILEFASTVTPTLDKPRAISRASSAHAPIGTRPYLLFHRSMASIRHRRHRMVDDSPLLLPVAAVSIVFAFAFLALLVVVLAGGSKPTVTWGTNPSSTLGLLYSRQPMGGGGGGRRGVSGGSGGGGSGYGIIILLSFWRGTSNS